MPSLAHDTTNDTRKDDFDSRMRELGRLYAQGQDARPMLALEVAYAAADGVISGEKDQDGNDDYSRAYALYTQSRDKKAVHEHTAGGLRAQISKLRQIGTAAQMTTCDFKMTVTTATSERQKLLKEKKKVRPAFDMYVELARTQLDQPDDLSPDQVTECALRPDNSKEVTVESECKRMHKIATDMIEGEKGVVCKEQWLVDIQNVLASQLSAFQVARDTRETIAKARELGLSIVEIESEPVSVSGPVLADNSADGFVA